MSNRILVVDDERETADASRVILEAWGYTVSCAYSGDEAVAEAKEFCPNLLLIDVMMPGLNGFETAIQVKELCPDCRLLFLSGNTRSQVSSMARNLNNHGYQFELVTKPMHPTRLLTRIKAVLAEGVQLPE
jgi:two-component system response regulator VicR